MRIKEFNIDNLYYEYNFSHKLDEKVNIFVGNNGSFKTTLLRLLRHAIAFERNGKKQTLFARRNCQTHGVWNVVYKGL